MSLKEAGLTGNEEKIYTILLKYDSLSANQIAKKLSMDRTLTYTILNHLIDKGLTSYIIKEKKKFFKASSPENLLNQIKKKEAIIRDLIPKLNAIKKTKPTKQEINIYEGKEGIRTLIRDVMQAKEFCSFGGTGRAYDILYEMPRLAKTIKCKARIITTKEHKNHPMNKTKNIQFKHLNIQSEATTTIYRDKVAIHLIKDKPIIIVIQNELIAQSYQNHFEVLWVSAVK